MITSGYSLITLSIILYNTMFLRFKELLLTNLTFNSNYWFRVARYSTDGSTETGITVNFSTPWCSVPAYNWTTCPVHYAPDIRSSKQLQGLYTALIPGVTLRIWQGFGADYFSWTLTKTFNQCKCLKDCLTTRINNPPCKWLLYLKI